VRVAAADMEYLFTAAAGASERVMVERQEARDRTVQAIREVERKVKEAVRGDCLRGLANMNPVYGEAPIQGARVVQPGGDIDKKVRYGQHAIVLNKDGAFMSMDVDDDGRVTIEAAKDEHFLAQDLDSVTYTVHTALQRHIARADRTVENYERLTSLAENLTVALSRR
jgi:hypothetical protein